VLRVTGVPLALAVAAILLISGALLAGPDSTPSGPVQDSGAAVSPPPADGPHAAASLPQDTLSLLNDTLSPGWSGPYNEYLPSAEAYDSATGELIVADATTSNLSVIDPASGSVVGIIHPPPGSCRTGARFSGGLVYDPNNGLLYEAVCYGQLVAIDPANGSLVANISLPGPAPVNASLCGPPGSYNTVIGLAGDFPAGRIFVLLTTCSGLVSGPVPLSVDILNDSRNTAALLTTVSSGLPGPGLAFTPGESIAYDPAHDELYVPNDNGSTYVGSVTVLNAASGAVVSNVSLGNFSHEDADSPLLYDPELGSVLTTYQVNTTAYPSSGSNFTAPDEHWTLASVPSGPAGLVVPLYNWTGECGGTPGFATYFGCGDAVPAALGFDPSEPSEVDLLLNGNLSFGGLPQGQVWQLDPGTSTLVASVALRADAYALTFSSDGATAFVLDQSNARVWQLAPNTLATVTIDPVGVLVDGATMDPANGDLLLAVGSECEAPAFGAFECDPRMLLVPPPYTRPTAEWSLPGSGAPEALVWDPANQLVYVYSSCQSSGNNLCLWLNTTSRGAGALVTAWTTSGRLMFESADVPELPQVGVQSAFDSGSGDVVFVGTGRESLELFGVNVSANATLPSVNLTGASSRCPGALSLTYDGPDDVLFAETSPCPFGPDTVRIDATTFTEVAAFNLSVDRNPWFDAATDTFWSGNAWLEGADDAVTGTIPTNEAGGYAYDSGSGLLQSIVSNGSNLSRVVIDPSTRGVLSSASLAPVTGPPDLTPWSWPFVDPASGELAVALGSVVLLIPPSTAGPFPVVFGESGLPPGDPWAVTLGGTTEPSTGTSVDFSEPNGSYAFVVPAAEGYAANLSAGTIHVEGVSVNVSIDFTPATLGRFAVLFSESGLPPGTPWGIDLNGTTESSSNGTVLFYAPNGTEPFLVRAPSGYVAAPGSGSIEVSGSPLSRAVAFSPQTTSSTGFLGLSGDEGYLLLGGIVAALGAASVVGFAWRRSRAPPR
jgi:hypothetical protein